MAAEATKAFIADSEPNEIGTDFEGAQEEAPLSPETSRQAFAVSWPLKALLVSVLAAVSAAVVVLCRTDVPARAADTSSQRRTAVAVANTADFQMRLSAAFQGKAASMICVIAQGVVSETCTNCDDETAALSAFYNANKAEADDIVMNMVGAQCLLATTTETTTTTGPRGICIAYGDPHLMTFDRFPNDGSLFASNAGDWWVVKSDRIEIKGNYQDCEGLKAWLEKLTIGGSFIGGHTLQFDEPNSAVTWDGATILDTNLYWTDPHGVGVTITKEEEAVNDWAALEGLDIEDIRTGTQGKWIASYKIKLPLSLEIEIQHATHGRACKFLEMLIQMHPEGTQHGHCGNFDGDPSNDNGAMLNSPENQVGDARRLFLSQAYNASEERARLLLPSTYQVSPQAAAGENGCDQSALEQATKLCTALCDGNRGNYLGKTFYDDCLLDACVAEDEDSSVAAAVGDCMRNAKAQKLALELSIQITPL
jgi:hypothetical protein